MECHTFEAKQRYMEKALCWLPRSGYWIVIHFFTQPISLNTDCMHRINILYNTWGGIRNICYANRYAVVWVMPLTHSSRVIKWGYPQTHILIGVFGMECHTFEAKQRYMEKPLCWLPRSGYWIGIHFFTQQISLKADYIHHINILYNTWGE